jgi:hypothetical protein
VGVEYDILAMFGSKGNEISCIMVGLGKIGSLKKCKMMK